MATIKSTDETFDNIVKENKIVLTDFWATWCGPCVTLAPILEQLSDELKDKGVTISGKSKSIIKNIYTCVMNDNIQINKE